MNEEKKIPTLPGVVVERSAMIKDRLTKFAQIEDLKLTADAELSEALGRIEDTIDREMKRLVMESEGARMDLALLSSRLELVGKFLGIDSEALVEDPSIVERVRLERDAAQKLVTEQLDVLKTMKEERDAAKAAAARLREELKAQATCCEFEQPKCAHCKRIDAALSATDSAEWLESKIAERVDELSDALAASRAVATAATNDAARAELRAKTIADAVYESRAASAAIGAVSDFDVAIEQVRRCMKAETRLAEALAVSPDSDARLREVMEKAWEKGRVYERQAVTKPSATDELNRRDDIDEVLRGGA